LYYGCADSLVAVATAPEAPAAEVLAQEAAMRYAGAGMQPPIPEEGEKQPGRGDFYLHNGDTIVFYGDSITEQNLYNQFVELYTVTRFPSMRVRFFGAGVGGDRVTGGSGGPIDQRLERDVFSEKPTVVTAMLGMNDGSYRVTTSEIESSYTQGYEHLLASIREHAPNARVTLLGPSPYDDVTRAPMFPGGYNAVMQHFAELDRGLAQKYKGTFVDLNPSVVAAIEKAEALDPRLAKLLLPDRVHPDPLAHWVMAEALLKGWNAPAVVSAVSIDAPTGRATETQNAAVDGVETNPGSVRWTETEDALPLPLARSNATQVLLLDLTDIEQQLDQEQLHVTGLARGRYRLTIDDTVIGTFSAGELAAGINLADFGTPMFHQAQRVSWLVRDRDEAHYIHLRMRVRNANTGGQAGEPDVMQAFEDSLADSIYEEAKPKPHIYTLNLVAEQP
jgi:lysophospholipase L1-like esterase